MRLYNTEGATQVDDPEYGTFKPDANGAFDGLPDGMYAKLHGRPGWENEAERVARVTSEQLEKMRDPATMLAELQKMSAGQGALATLLAQALGVTPAPAPAEGPAETSKASSSTSAQAPAQDGGPGAKTSVETAEETATAKATGRGRGGRSAKSAASDAS